MSDDLPTEDLQEIASRFSSLLRILTHGNGGERPRKTRDMLIDRLRDALDRRLPQLPSENPAFIARSFLLEETVDRRARTEIGRLRHRDLGTLHALKTVPADRVADAVDRDLLLREARIGMALRHPCLVQTQMVLRLADGRPAIVMEWAGQPLSERLSSSLVSISAIIAGMRRLLRGLRAIHDTGYVHCDISPGNLLLPDDDFSGLKIADFGVALERGKRHRDLDIRITGTPSFMAPEQADDAAADPRNDLYCAGRVLSLLLERCQETGNDAEGLKALAGHLSASDASMRPASAGTALGLLDEAERNIARS
ncbi:protein kinase [Rhizobium sp. BK602]|uniref:protein kinase domain-containing protein n=1 Tax=Rhizobium sp. BK602 TaxID=2586986 RepID=UPI001608B9DA|nr:protein kinase [Rhizobium sp. BK602]MBB3610148.1 type VI secretion system protein ImpN [Rhizobium sp. BK602]